MKKPKITKITFGHYEDSFPKTDITKDKDGDSIAIMGLAGEIGDLLSEFKKELRGDIALNQYKDAICEEIGDCLWYLTKICDAQNTSLSKVLGKPREAFLDDYLDDYLGYLAKICDAQGKSLSKVLGKPREAFLDDYPDDYLDCLLDGLLHDKGVVDWGPKKIASSFITEQGKLVDSILNGGNFEKGIKKLVALLAFTAKSFNLTLGQAADSNIKKTTNRFSKDYSSLKLHDEDFPWFEQLPRKLKVDIMEKEVGKDTKAMLFIDGFIYGNPLEDNITGVPDHYRYHDVFHLAFAANLCWSPNLRALLSRKRKSKPKVDKNEDGGRARVMEEGIVHLVFRYGEENDFFKGIKNPRVSASLLNSIEAMVKGFEVDDRPLSLWNKAICDGFRIFLQVREHRQGEVSIDLKKRTIKFKP